MNIREVKQSLPFLLNERIVPFFWGTQGVGKTQVVEQFGKENGYNVIVLNTATQDPGDLIGLLVKDEKGGTYHAKPQWFPTEGKHIIFLDELNRAPNDVLQCLFPFIQKGELHTHKLSPESRIIAAGNYNSDRFTVTDTSDSAWLSRFCHIDFTPTVEEWLMYAEDHGHFEMAAFIRENPGMLELSAKDGGRLDTSFVVPDRRSTTSVAKLDSNVNLPDSLKYELFSGMIGTAAAASFMTWKNKKERALSLGQILKDYKTKTRKRVLEIVQDKDFVRGDLLDQPITELLTKLDNNKDLLKEPDTLNNVKQYLIDIPREFSMKAFVALGKMKFEGKDSILNDPEYVKKFA